MRFEYKVPLGCFLLKGSTVPLIGTVTADTRSEARAKLKKLFGFDRVPQAAVIERIKPVLILNEPGMVTSSA